MANVGSSSSDLRSEVCDDCQQNNTRVEIPLNLALEVEIEEVVISPLHPIVSVSSIDYTCGELEEGHDEHQLNDDEIQEVIKSLDEKLEGIRSSQRVYDIFRVTPQLHKLNPEAYTPQSVSIGPLHYNKEHLRTMETHKLQYLKHLLNRGHGKRLDVFVKAVSNLEEKALKSYSEANGLGKDEFVRMMVVDSCFILEFVHIIVLREKDHLVSHYLWHCKIREDLIKLENQIPLFVLKKLYGLIFGQSNEYFFSHNICLILLGWFGRALHGPTPNGADSMITSLLLQGEAKHFVDLLRNALIPSSLRKVGCTGKINQLRYCASKLSTAGVKFQKKVKSESPETSLFDIEFEMEKGVLKIPVISVFDSTELVLRNLIAYEQGFDKDDHYFTAYAAFMDGLIDDVKDVELLVHEGIIENGLGSPEDVVNLFNNITKHVVLGRSCFSTVITQLEDYYMKPWNGWKANLMQNYFNTPWAHISFAAAVFLLVLTVVQTVCSILQVK